MRCSDVSSVLSSLPLSHDTIICGDLNARLGDITGDSGSNSRGATVLDWCMDNNLSILNRHLSFGVPTLVDFRRGRPVSSIVDYFITNLVPYDASLPSASLTVASDLSLGSDHKLMSLSFEYCPPQASVVHPSPTTSSASLSSFRRCWNLSRLKEPDVCDLFYHKFASLAFSLVQDLRALVSSPPRSRPDIDAINQRLNDAIYTALDQSVGARAQRPAHWKKFWTPDLQEAADRRERYYRRWKHSRSAMDKIYWWNMHVEAHAKFKQDLRRAKQVSWRAFCDSLEKDDFGTVVLPKVKRIKSRRQRQSGFVHPDGDSAGAIALRDHLASVYSGSSLPSVKRMLSLAEAHSLELGYRWSPSKCALLNPPSSTSTGFVPLKLYGQDLPIVDEFIYLGVPFRRNGICSSSVVLKGKPGALASMAHLRDIGANRSGFSFLLSSRLYASFVRPKVEYGLAITRLLSKDYKALERIQDTCLRMIFGGHRAASTMVFIHLVNLPSLRFRADTLVLKYCRRASSLPEDCLLSLLCSSLPNPSLPGLRSLRMVQDMPASVSGGSDAAVAK
ncbi:hypothetical protein IWQ62_002200, partial [Dispira parvispora]